MRKKNWRTSLLLSDSIKIGHFAMTHPVGRALQAVKLDSKFRKIGMKTWNHMKSNIIVFIDSNY